METNNKEQNLEEEMKMPDAPLTESHHSKVGLILGVLIIILVLVLAGVYLWGGLRVEETSIQEQPIVNNESETPNTEEDAQIFETLSPSDELDAIEADLDGTNLDSLENDLTAIDAELDAALGQ